MGNLELWNNVRVVPQEAQKPIQGGRLKGKTDINPMWRIMTLTEIYGLVGVGWKYEITRQWSEDGAGGEKCAFCNINLYIKQDGEWSEGIPGTGGSMLVENEKAGPHTSDECYKMALTDAISVACKALGFGADIYWQHGGKYGKEEESPPSSESSKTGRGSRPTITPCCVCGKMVGPDFAEKSRQANGGKVYCSGTCKAYDNGDTA